MLFISKGSDKVYCYRNTAITQRLPCTNGKRVVLLCQLDSRRHNVQGIRIFLWGSFLPWVMSIKMSAAVLPTRVRDGFTLLSVGVVNCDYISLTDMVKNIENGLALIEKWLRNKNTIEFLGIWEEMYNPDFNSPEFEGIKNEAGLNRFVLSVKQWTQKTNSRGIIAKAGRYGGTYAHETIAFEFASWVSPQFKLYLIKEFQRLKDEEYKQLGWDIKRNLAKINYRIHTDAIKENLIPPQLTPQQINQVYASEADVLNVALFGITAKQWRDANSELKGNIRDYANVSQLVCLSNMENLNEVFIGDGIPQSERLAKLNAIAISQMKLLTKDHRVSTLEEKHVALFPEDRSEKP